jgi:hypothetical protein
LQEPDFEEDRIVVREGEEVPKKGWFSTRGKPSAQGTPTSASQPPSLPPGQSQKPNEQARDDDDLPPRELRTPPVLASPLPGQGVERGTGDVDGDIVPDVPARAGFDLAAMRAVIEGIGEGKESQREFAQPEMSSSSSSLQLPAESVQRPRSTSPPVTRPVSGRPSGVHRRATDVFGDPAPAKALSLNDVRDEPLLDSEDGRDDHVADDMNGDSTSLSTLPSHSLAAAGSVPTPSFASNDGMPWSSVSTIPDKEILGGFETPFGNPFRPTPFAAAVGDSASASLTVPGGVSVTAADRDPWTFRTRTHPHPNNDVSASTTGKQQPSVFAANPWES